MPRAVETKTGRPVKDFGYNFAGQAAAEDFATGKKGIHIEHKAPSNPNEYTDDALNTQLQEGQEVMDERMAPPPDLAGPAINGTPQPPQPGGLY